MKTFAGIFIIFLLTFFVIDGQSPVSKKESDSSKTIGKYKASKIIKGKDHSKLAINCKTCHYGEYPTRKDPQIIQCPRNKMISVYHSPEEGPEIVMMDDLVNKYSKVIFAHKIHAQMSEMSNGCSGCHHYNTTGPVLNCKNCHEIQRKREYISKPDLEGAIHRQCMKCHAQWSHTTGCDNTCHVPKNKDNEIREKEIFAKISGKTHPALPKPEKMIYETNYSGGKIVTFFHDEHSKLFGLGCINCHRQENCIKCHDSKHTTAGYADISSKTIKIKKTVDEHHQPCASCHGDDKCSKCHKDSQMTPFNHNVSTGFPLIKFHNNLSCNRCHEQTPIKKVDKTCSSCHSDWKVGNFNHNKTGLALDETHNQLDCENCHENKNFDRNPTCNNCHDDKNSKNDKPGKLVKRKI
ncbi:MAG: cytochrome c3 family protein [FCB group bacterium]